MRLNLTQMRLDVEETGPRQVRLERARDTQTKVAFEVTEQQDKLRTLETIRDDNTAAVATMGQTSLQLVLTTLGIGLVAVDSIVQYMVNSSTISAVSPTTWIIASPCIALAVGGLTHGVAQALTYNPTRPQRSVRRCLQYAGFFGTACAIALAIFLFGRTANEELVPYLVTAVSASLWTLAEALPITGGLLSAAAHHMAYPALHARRIRRVKERLAALDAFTQWLTQEQQRLEDLPAPGAESSGSSSTPAPAAPVAPVLPRTGARSVAGGLAAVTLLLVSLMPLTACTRASAAAGTPPIPVSRQAATVSPVVADRRTTGGIVPSVDLRAQDTICQSPSTTPTRSTRRRVTARSTRWPTACPPSSMPLRAANSASATSPIKAPSRPSPPSSSRPPPPRSPART